MEDGEEEVLEGDFTFRAVFVGLLVGVVLCMTNIYFGLQTGKLPVAYCIIA